MSASEKPPPDQAPGLAPVIDRNIRALLEHRRAEERSQSRQTRLAAAITRFTGSMTFVYIHVVLVAAWVLINLGATPLPKFDPSFVVLAMVASVEAIFLSTFVLITQNRMAALADKRADLDLQISLLSEHEITQVMALVSAMAAKMKISGSDNPDLESLKTEIPPEAVLDRIEAMEKHEGPGSPGAGGLER